MMHPIALCIRGLDMDSSTTRKSPMLRQLECEEAIDAKFFETLEVGLSVGYSPAEICAAVRSLAEQFLGRLSVEDETAKRFVIVLRDLRPDNADRGYN